MNPQHPERLENLRLRLARVKNGDINEPQGQKGLSSKDIIQFVAASKQINGVSNLPRLWTTAPQISHFISRQSFCNINESNINDAEVILDFLEQKYEAYINTIVQQKPIQEKIEVDNLTQYFIGTLRQAFNEKFNSQNDKNITDYISKRKKIHKDSVDEFITAFPSYFASIISKKINVDEISDFIECSNFHSYNINTLKSKVQSTQKIENFEGILLGQALSPIPDNITLLMEIGKLKRFETVYGKKSNIVLTNEEYAFYNEISKTLMQSGITESAIEEGYAKSLKYRKQFYGLLGFHEGENLEILSVDSSSPYLKLSREQFFKDTDYYVDFASEIKEINKELYKDKDNVLFIISEMLSEDKMDKEIDEVLSRYRLLKHVQRHKLPLNVLSIIKRYFSNIDRDTIYYTFLQRYAQHKYSQFIKFGNRRELNFDCTYALLDGAHNEHDLNQNLNDHVLHAFYYKHYNLPDQSGELVNTIPYYTPNKAMFNKMGGNIEEIQNTIPLVTDSYEQEGDGTRKIKHVAASLPLQEIAKQTSDLISFAVYAFRNTNTNYWEEVNTLAAALSGDFSKSLGEDRLDDQVQLLQDFGHQALTIMCNYIKIPYFYYPYIIYLKAELKNDHLLGQKLRTFYKDFVRTTMKELQSHINFPGWNL